MPKTAMNKPRLALALACATVWTLTGCSRHEPPPEPVRAVRTQVVGGAVSSSEQSFAAEIKARTEARLSFRVGGKMLSRPVNVGDVVRGGQVLAQLDPTDLKLGQDAARAAVAAAQSAYDQSAADHKRSLELKQQGFIGAAAMDQRDAALKAAKAQLDQARAQAGVQVNQAGYASLTADAGGVVTAVEAEPGQVLSAGTPVVRLALDGPRDAVFSVPEQRASALRALIGKRGAVRLRLWESNDTTPITVREVAAAADSATRTFLVKADIGAVDVRLGQTATVLLSGPAQSDTIRLPLPAVVEAQGKSAVWLLDGAAMTVRQQPVAVATADGNTVVIASGVKAGDEVVVAGTHVLVPGQKVRRFVEPGQAAVAALPASATKPASAAR